MNKGIDSSIIKKTTIVCLIVILTTLLTPILQLNAQENLRVIDSNNLIYLPLVLGPPLIPGRFTTDRTDDTDNYQIHFMYVLPSDGEDQKIDVNGTLKTSILAAQNWMKQQTSGRSFRIDTYQGEFDITFVRLNKSDSEIQSSRSILSALTPELEVRGFNHPKKIYVVYYAGHASYCGEGAWPPAIIGRFAGIYLKACEKFYNFASSPTQPSGWEFVSMHEIVHTLGFAAPCAPHKESSNNAHVNDDPRDLLYAGNKPWRPSILDVNRDDYFEHHIPGCLDLASSIFLDPAKPDAIPPPGWTL